MDHNNTYLVVIDPTLQHQPAFERAMQSAQMSGATLLLFECVSFDNAMNVNTRDDDAKQQVLDYYQTQLDRLQDMAGHMGINAITELQWAKGWGQSVVDAAKRHDIYMVFKSSYFHSNAERSENTADWTLLRECHCPVLLMHHTSLWSKRKVLAAVNLAVNDETHKKLNQKVIDIASSFRSSFDSEVHFVNSIRPETREHLQHAVHDTDDILIDAAPSAYQAAQAELVYIDEDALMKACGCDKDFAHIVEGDPTDVIANLADELDVDLIVVGNAARKGIKGRVIGNTAEKLLDQTKHDVLSLS